MYSVIYTEVKPASRQQALMAFREHAKNTRTQDGFAAIELFEQRGRAGHFVLLETWQDQATLDAQAPLQALLATALGPLRLSDIDRRPYKALDIATAKAGGNKAVYVVSHVDAAPPSPAVNDMLQQLVTTSRTEPGNLRFDLLQHQQRANHFTVVEAWRDDAALQAHSEAAHTLRFRDQFGPFAGSPLDERLFDAVQL